MTDDPMDCDELVEIVSDYLDDELDPAQRARFDAHLLECDGCAAYLQQFRTTVTTLGRITPDQLDPDFRERLSGALRSWRR